MLRKLVTFSAATLALISVGILIGCSRSTTEAPSPAGSMRPQEPREQGARTDGEHGHKPGGHGGNVVEIGRDNYHAEAVFEKGGTLKLYLLGKDEAKVQEVESQVLTGYARVEGGTEATPLTLRPVPQPGDAEGKTSQFVGKLPQELRGKKVEVTVPSITIAGERFRFGFTSAAEGHDEGMPARPAQEEERKLYLTPGGKYTAEDIKANGGQTASEKFRGLTASHDLRPRPGDKICPITLTKASSKFSWVVGGKSYQFCCPPCVDEFVQTAKDHPEEIKEPQDYVKKQ
jgi:YHS domain-containing protein